ncbi:SWIM zinc finger family protein [Halorubellus sp. PRR65]|uniref:SWIM zinc finger family protein n=1 Tax=Halorubellus sp. PRR65 TaxID=3098148 RepID=UPI002B260E8A|nr:SWIM zinc finger family protein [Halorubellus sp. PRR65]
MSTTKPSNQKRTAVEHLTFTALTRKRAEWEAWEFTVVGPYQVKVTNASYGYLSEEHAYVVGVEEREGVVVPAECACPADVHGDKACKHRVAAATVAGPTVLNAAVDFENPAPDPDALASATTAADLLTLRGGVPDDAQSEECPECAGLSSMPCWACVRDGKRSVEN